MMRSIVHLLLGIPIFLMLDSQYGDAVFGDGQAVATVLVFLVFVRAYYSATQRVRDVMLIGIVVGLAGEFLFSIVLGMYHYRLENIPLWLAFGHGLIFAWVFKVSRAGWLRARQKMMQQVLIAFALVYSVGWLIWANDWYGFVCTMVFMAILFTAKKSRLFFLIMFVVVCYIEQVGIATGCWYWPETAFHIVSWLPSGNPPSGIAVFYFLFDAVVFWIYLQLWHRQTKRRYQNIMQRKPDSLKHG